MAGHDVQGRALSSTVAGSIYVFDEEGGKFQAAPTYGMDAPKIAAFAEQPITIGNRYTTAITRKEPLDSGYSQGAVNQTKHDSHAAPAS